MSSSGLCDKMRYFRIKFISDLILNNKYPSHLYLFYLDLKMRLVKNL